MKKSEKKEGPVAKVGRPSLYTEQLADLICERIAQGFSLTAILGDPGMPSYTQVMKWLTDKPDFAEKYTRAREDQADFLADEIVRIADEAEDANKARVRIDARKWVASKLKPKKYSERLMAEHTGANGGPIETSNRIDLSDLTKDERAALAGIISRRAGKS